MKLDSRRRPISTLTPGGRQHVAEQLLGVWDAHPGWSLGQLVTKLVRASTLHGTSVEFATDDDIQRGMDALVPAGWEIDEGDTREVEPVALGLLD